MRIFWRLCCEPFAATAMSGEGARLFGGRWNRVGTPMVYCASALSLCALEILVHSATLPRGFVAIRVEAPLDSTVERWDLASLPANWRDMPAPEGLAERGSEWARSGRTLLLEVPSTIVPHETNVLVNPLHPDARRLIIGAPQPFPFDSRLK